MNRAVILASVAMLVLLGIAVVPVSAQPGGEVDECMNADKGPGENGPPGFVGSLISDFLSDLFASLPVPNFVKAFFGASTC